MNENFKVPPPLLHCPVISSNNENFYFRCFSSVVPSVTSFEIIFLFDGSVPSTLIISNHLTLPKKETRQITKLKPLSDIEELCKNNSVLMISFSGDNKTKILFTPEISSFYSKKQTVDQNIVVYFQKLFHFVGVAVCQYDVSNQHTIL